MNRHLKSLVLLFSLFFVSQVFAEFSTCRFNFGMCWQGDNYNYPSELDYIAIWAGSDEEFNQYWQGSMLKACLPGGKLDGKTPVYYSYIIAFTARRDWGLQDCNVGTPNLCQQGAQYIRTQWPRITGQYEKYASGTARIWGTSKPIIWLMEPDYYQFASSSQQGGGLTFAELGQKMAELVAIIKRNLPNAIISMDISPWNTNQSGWYGSFKMADFSFVNTSGGGTEANSSKIRNTDPATWRGIFDISGKAIIADDGYGVAGASTGHDPTWDDPSNLNARIADGVIAITQANPRSDWNGIITNLRPKLNKPLVCGGGSGGGGSTCTPTAITPYVQINGGNWQGASSATVNQGATVIFGPQPIADGWSWSGPNGYSANTREISITNINSTKAGDYIATYTNPSGCKSTMKFTVTVNGTGTCTPTAITPYVQINGGAWQNASSATVNQGATVKFGPQPIADGWSWSGPNGYSANTREITITGVTSATAGNYVATYTNSSGCKSTKTFAVSISGGSNLTIRARGTCGSEQMQLLINNSVVKTWDNIGTSLADFTYTGLSGSASIKVQFSNDGAVNGCDKNIFVDYIVINGATIQAEAQSVNTGVWTGTTCGGAASEWLHCNGYIDFGTRTIVLGKALDVQNSSLKLPGKDFWVSVNSNGLKLDLSGFNSNAAVSIYDLKGVAVYRNVVSANSITIPELKKGMYIINVQQGKMQVEKKVIVR